ncbi:hypothetical protein B0H11DRAFT_2012632 [Mycena galericulata]|nr:hypothetical protein B0H11DRAFT_2012632 [Mycena galericulata]
MLREHPTPPPHLDIPPFCPRAQQPPSTTRHFNHRAALFYGIYSRLPSHASRAACARYRLSRKAAPVAPVAPDTTSHLARLRTQLANLQELLHLTFLRPLPPSSPTSSTSPIGHPAPVVSQHLRTTCILLPDISSSISTPLQGPSEASNGASRPFVDFGGFFGGFFLSGHMLLGSQ